MIQIKKSEIIPILLSIAAFDSKTQRMVSGLLTENLTLGTKRKLQKIQKELAKLYEEYKKEVQEIEEECKEDKEKREKEIKELIEEEVKIEADKLSFSFLENVSTTSVYDLEIIEKITE